MIQEPPRGTFLMEGAPTQDASLFWRRHPDGNRVPIGKVRFRPDGSKTKNTPLTQDASLFWRRHPESDRGIKVLQTSALPLGYGAEKMERITGLEPATSTLARWRSTK